MTTIQNFIGGQWVPPSTGEYGQSVNPAHDMEVVARYPLSAKSDVDRAVQAAVDAFPGWRAMPAPRRAEILFRAAEILCRRKDELGQLVTREMGKVLSEGLGDVQEAIDMAYFMAGEGRRLQGETVPCELPNKDAKSFRVPWGVFALITPWNFPIAIPSWKIFASLICGNTVVFKPSSDSPLCATRLVEVLEEAGMPPGVVNMITGAGETVGETLAMHPDVQGVSFTGSCSVGEALACSVAQLHRPIAMEMGGKNAILIMDDADLDLALEGVLWGAFGTTGQRCTAASRIIVHEKVYDEFLDRLVRAANAMRLGDGLEKDTDVGPLINRRALNKVLNYIRIGKDEGARLCCGGNQAKHNGLTEGYFVEPTVFSNVTPSMRIAQEEIFGPVVCLIKCDSYEQGIAIVNQSRFGLSTAIYTRDVNISARAEGDLDSGLVYINASTIGAEIQLPFGGFKHSGSGHPEAGGRMGALDFFSRIKVVYRDFSGKLQKAQIDIT
ncbi:NADP-dependent 2,5-dioxopentanoate dehydrogenase [Syntrophotalea carbinolica DSM 2380]|uniref:NADP-dependent 2,5-dioxopentanoate dehydrogenase n=1 Tax=Syntrophotalea carbinolica (strain DSM 2380 / NBRC 103641 / GraBd1) TaxID=338963 RepID=Q3A4G5_SYNC1|nr:aldehyde dehydrogenase family protein [Syntrophotalea carbinolica]ABA88742.1 NADP-dependent 2,5-dioxopentanoate dehydrogenase [Syntrophotalea carbinolica DSM 2380]